MPPESPTARKDDAMLYVARTLIMPTGEHLHSRVFSVFGGRVVSVTPFVGESHSMRFVDEAVLSPCACALFVTDIKQGTVCSDGPLYAYSVGRAGVLERLM